MQIGTSIVLIAFGAILHFAVTASVAGIDIQTAGLILIVVGVVGLIISLLMGGAISERHPGRRTVVTERQMER